MRPQLPDLVYGSPTTRKAAIKSVESIYAQDHIIAERKRREKINQRFIELSTVIPGLKKSHFTIDASNKKAVDYACIDLLKKGQRNMRYLLKKKYFNGIPANQVRTTSPLSTMKDEEWKALVDMWSNPKHKEKMFES